VLAFAHVFDFFAHELTSLGRRGFPLPRILRRSFDCPIFWHIHPPSADTSAMSRSRNATLRSAELFPAVKSFKSALENSQ
jgi:hypothetical protein